MKILREQSILMCLPERSPHSSVLVVETRVNLRGCVCLDFTLDLLVHDDIRCAATCAYLLPGITSTPPCSLTPTARGHVTATWKLLRRPCIPRTSYGPPISEKPKCGGGQSWVCPVALLSHDKESCCLDRNLSSDIWQIIRLIGLHPMLPLNWLLGPSNLTITPWRYQECIFPPTRNPRC